MTSVGASDARREVAISTTSNNHTNNNSSNDAALSWSKTIVESLGELLRHLQLLRVAATADERHWHGGHIHEVPPHIQQRPMHMHGSSSDTGTATSASVAVPCPGVSLETVALLTDCVECDVKRLLPVTMKSCDASAEGMQVRFHLLEVLNSCSECISISRNNSSSGAFSAARHALPSLLDNVVACVKVALDRMQSSNATIVESTESVVVCLESETKSEHVERVHTGLPIHRKVIRCITRSLHSVSWWLRFDSRVILSAAALRVMAGLWAVVVILAVTALILDRGTLSVAQSSNSLGDGFFSLGGGRVNRCSIRFAFDTAQLALTLGLGFVLLRALAAKTSEQAAVEALLDNKALRMRIDDGTAHVVEGRALTEAQPPLSVASPETPRYVHSVDSKQKEEQEEQHQQQQNTEVEAFSCGKAFDVGATTSSSSPLPWNHQASLPQLAMMSNTPVVFRPIPTDADNNSEAAATPDEDDAGFVFPPLCAQAEREVPRLLGEVQSGVADRYNDFAQFLHVDRTAKVCRHLVENVQDCVCPLVVVECSNLPTTGRSNRRSTASAPKYPVVYCNFAALELLHYRWLTDVAGKELKSVLSLYRSARRPTGKRRSGGGRKVSTLPALPQTQHQTSHGRLFLVPAPPSQQQQQKQREKRQRLEEISDIRWLFEEGVEEQLTVLVTQKASYFDVYAMSISQVTLPSSFCDPTQHTTPHSAEKSYLVLLFLRPVTSDLDGVPRPVTSSVAREETIQRTSKRQSTVSSDPVFCVSPISSISGGGGTQKRASTTGSSTVYALGNSAPLTTERDGADVLPRHSLTNQRSQSTRTAAAVTHKRSKRRSTTKGSWSPMSVERGHVVDQITAHQLRQKLESLTAVREVEVSTGVPDTFLLNFVALMIFVHRMLKRHKRVKCRVDAENMFIILEITAEDGVRFIRGDRRSMDDGASSSSHDVTTSDSGSKGSGTPDGAIGAFLSPSLLEYLHVCDASIHLNPNGCIIRFPYTTNERLALMGDVGTLQLSTVKGLSLFGVAATNALTEEALALTSGEMIHLDQYAAAEEAFSEAIRKTKSLPPRRRDAGVKNFPPPMNKGGNTGQEGNNVFFFGVPLVQPMEEVAGSSLDSMCGLPFVLGGHVVRSLEGTGNAAVAETVAAAAAQEAAAAAVTAASARASKSCSDAAQSASPDWPSGSGQQRVDNIFGKSHTRSGSDAMGTSISCNSPLGANVTSYCKRYLHVFLYMKEHRPDVIQQLWARGHSATVVTDPAVMKRYLLIGMNIFDVVFIEWNEKLVKPDIRDLIAADSGKQSTTLYLLNEDVYSLPLPPGTPDEAVLRMRDIADIFTDPAIGHNVSLYIRQRRLRHEMVQIRWRKSYQIVRQIGGGAFGDVYEVYVFVSRGRLAMKRLFLNGANNHVLEQLNREVLIMSQLDHPNIVGFSHSSMEENAYCIFMELCDGTLDSRIHSDSVTSQNNRNQQRLGSQQPPLPRLSAPAPFQVSSVSSTPTTSNLDSDGTLKGHEHLTARELVLVLHDIASGIAYLHSQGIVHRDIKPGNILFVNGVAKIGDFGSAAEERTAKPLTNMKGTLAYMSPEVVLGEPYGKPCDMWSFGCLVAEVIGLRLGHLQGLHMPALVELYKSIPPTGSLPITVANYKGGTLQHHYGESTAQKILGAMKTAYNDACNERREAVAPRRRGASITRRDKNDPFHHEDSEDTQHQSCTSCDSTRAVAYISTNSTAFLGSGKAELPESLVELLEALFHRDPQQRMTAEEVLDHPVTWDVEWVEMVTRAVEEICPLEADYASAEASHGGESTAGMEDSLNLSINST
ncbi:putative protein kinase [Trypanosoma grayi]|uniref:putative protein kinase n=1 Tax=Trypanosoma grayi TaxID=71804 RepID=UPI0004F3F59A|nr:putative protein kinase [Trypanosoma grayi]KEG11112.1 putative protein kinase [Trypanosoma grayi]